MVTTLLPESLWEILAYDLLGPIDNNIYVLLVIDYYRRWIEIDVLKSVTSTMIIASLEQMFLTYGLICSDLMTSPRDLTPISSSHVVIIRLSR